LDFGLRHCFDIRHSDFVISSSRNSNALASNFPVVELGDRKQGVFRRASDMADRKRFRAFHLVGFESLEASFQIAQDAEASVLVFVDPALGNLLEGDRVEVVQFLAAPPDGDDKVGLLEEGEMFGDGLACYGEVLGEFAQGLAIVHVKLVEQLSPVGVSQGFKNLIHLSARLRN
jgi:hypothetical protein